MEPFVVLSWDNTLQPFGVKPHSSGSLPGASYEDTGQNTQSSSPKCLSWISKCCHPELFQPISLSMVCFISCFPSAPFSFFEHLFSSASSSATVCSKENPSFFLQLFIYFNFPLIFSLHSLHMKDYQPCLWLIPLILALCCKPSSVCCSALHHLRLSYVNQNIKK